MPSPGDKSPSSALSSTVWFLERRPTLLRDLRPSRPWRKRRTESVGGGRGTGIGTLSAWPESRGPRRIRFLWKRGGRKPSRQPDDLRTPTPPVGPGDGFNARQPAEPGGQPAGSPTSGPRRRHPRQTHTEPPD